VKSVESAVESAVETILCSALELLDERYLIQELIGEGALSWVFSAVDLTGNVAVAVNVL